MRVAPFLLPLSLYAAPAVAQSVAPVAPAEPQLIQVPPALADPATADRLADTIQSLSEAVLDVRVGGVQAALEGRKVTPSDRNMTVRDLARRGDPNFDRHLQQRIAEARPQIEQGIAAVNSAIPEINRSLVDAQRAIERAIANMPDPNYPKR
jgi:hypothetical protein